MSSHNALGFLGRGPMSEKIRHFDWSRNPLGPPEHWPRTLKTTLGNALASHFPKCVVWGDELITLYNDAFVPILGNKPEALGRPFSDVWSEAWDQIGPIARQAYAGEATFIEDFGLIVDRNGYAEQAYFTFCYSPIRDENGAVLGMLDTVVETTGKVEAERHARVLNAELQHRIKNTLAVVSSIVAHTLRSATTPKAAESAMMFRLKALSEGHLLLSHTQRADADISALVRTALEAHLPDDTRVSITGDPYRLPEKQALSLALAVNELATNALKYGALSGEGGRVAISWDVWLGAEADTIRFTWHEKDGPEVTPPTRRGFGSRLIEQVVAADFEGSAQTVFDRSGLRYELNGRVVKL